MPIPDPAFWDDFGRHLIVTEAQPRDYLLCRQKSIPKGKPPNRRPVMHRFHDQPIGSHGTHDWWHKDWDVDQLAETMLDVLAEDDS